MMVVQYGRPSRRRVLDIFGSSAKYYTFENTIFAASDIKNKDRIIAPVKYIEHFICLLLKIDETEEISSPCDLNSTTMQPR